VLGEQYVRACCKLLPGWGHLHAGSIPHHNGEHAVNHGPLDPQFQLGDGS
jgi:hypothetical protein